MKSPRKPDRSDPLERIKSHYEHRIDSRRANFDVLDWASPESQEERFRVFAENVDLRDRTLLDIGCGLGDLWGFLKRAGVEANYTGVDILAKMVDAARRHHPDVRFVCADVFSGDAPEPGSFDVVFCSGTLNLNLGNHERFLPAAIRRMTELSAGCVAFNLLHKRSAGSDDTYAYSDPEHVARIVADLGWSWRIIEDYLPNDFTVIAEPGA